MACEELAYTSGVWERLLSRPRLANEPAGPIRETILRKGLGSSTSSSRKLTGGIVKRFLDLSAGRRRNLALIAVLAISAFLNLYRLNTIGINGIGNFYYAAAVQSMLTSLHNFFYLSVDPTGFVSLDKPPLAFWVQAASAKLFGFRGLSLLLPEALAGVAAVYLLYRLVRRAYGERAGLLAALALAVTPISVVTNRNNAPDALLILVLLAAAWMLVQAIAASSARWLFGTAALIGVAFNIKMLQILLVVPTLALLYLAAMPWPWRKRLLYGAAALIVAALVALPWVMAVELTPPAQRPYVGGSLNNTVLDLILGYNGIARLWGEDFTFYSGPPGPLRLFNDKLGGQIAWLLPLAVIGGLLAAWQTRQGGATSSAERTARRNALILWAAWAIPQMIYFSISTFFHRYYLATLAPAVAALAGIGADALWRAWREGGRGDRAVALAAFLVCAGVEATLLLPFAGWRTWLIPPVALISVAVCGILLAAWRFGRIGKVGQAAAFAAGILALLIAPLVWTLIPVTTCTDYTLPYGGPQVVGASQGCRPINVRPFFDRQWVDLFEQGRDGARYLAATHDMGIAALGILGTHEPFMALGGFRGSDPILTVEQFAALVARGEVRFYTAMQDAAEFPVQKDIRQWVKVHCPQVMGDEGGIFIWGPCDAVK